MLTFTSSSSSPSWTPSAMVVSASGTGASAASLSGSCSGTGAAAAASLSSGSGSGATASVLSLSGASSCDMPNRRRHAPICAFRRSSTEEGRAGAVYPSAAAARHSTIISCVMCSFSQRKSCHGVSLRGLLMWWLYRL